MTRQEVDNFIKDECRRIDANNVQMYIDFYNAFGKEHNINLWYESKVLGINKMRVIEKYNLLERFYEFVKNEFSWR